MTDARRTPLVAKKDLAAVERPEKLSQTALSHFDRCPRSAFLYWKHKGGPASAAMVRGSVFHRFVEEAVEMIRDDEDAEGRMPPEVAKANIMALIEAGELVEPDEHGEDRVVNFHLPEYEQNALRAMAWNWAEATVIDPEYVVGLEQMIELELAGWTVRGKLDFAEIGPFGALIRDYKTSINLPSKDDIEHGAKSFQGKFYALLLLFGIPEGESFPLGKGLEECRVELAYPRYTNQETGELIGRETTWTRDQLVDFRHSLDVHLSQIEAGLKGGDFPAQSGSWCNTECPARAECPIPKEYQEPEKIETYEQAQVALEVHMQRDAEQRALMRSVSQFHEDYAAPIFVGDYTFHRRQEIRKSVDWDAVPENGVVTPDLVTPVRSTPFKKRKTTPEEREERDG